MNKKIKKIIFLGPIPKKKQISNSRISFIWNYIGKQKNCSNCFGCSDNLWWKTNVAMAYTEHNPDEIPFGKYTSETEDKIREMKTPVLYLGARHGVIICLECFINKSKKELIEIFETVAKPLWMKGQKLEQIEKIRNYSLYLPIRTTGGEFKKEMVSIKEKRKIMLFNKK